MSINPVNISTVNTVEDNFDVVVEILTQRPTVGEYLTTAVTPNQLVGYYDSSNDKVELYISDVLGRRYFLIGG
jgi:hypothetical protein